MSPRQEFEVCETLRPEPEPGILGLERLIPHATLHPTSAPVERGCIVYVCLPCCVSLPTVSSAEHHLLTTSAHVGQVAAKRAVSGMQNFHGLLPRMRLESALDALSLVQPAVAAAPQAPRMGGKVMLRALLGEDQGVAITILRSTSLATLPGLLLEKLDGSIGIRGSRKGWRCALRVLRFREERR